MHSAQGAATSDVASARQPGPRVPAAPATMRYEVRRAGWLGGEEAVSYLGGSAARRRSCSPACFRTLAKASTR